MPNHLHFIIATPYRNSNLNKLIGNGKRFLAYDIVEQLKKTVQANLLQQLADEVIPGDRKRGKLHQVFKPSFDWKLITSEKMLFQNITYIHHNPVKGKWNLVSDTVL